jgi:hypothetical protein
MEETMKDLQRQQSISDLEPRFWKSVTHDGGRDGSFFKRIHDVRSVNREFLDRSSRFEKVTFGDLERSQSGALRQCVVKDRETDAILMKYYEKKTSWDCDGKLKPEDYMHRVGPAQYFYPDGRLAALELYDEKFDISHRKGCIVDPFLYGEDGNRLDHFSLVAPDGRPRNIGQTLTDANGNVVNVEDYDRVMMLYFDKEGNSIPQADFDVIYMKELDSMGLFASRHKEHFEYAPRIGDYNDLVNDLFVEMTVGGDRFSPQDIRELHLADKPDDYLDMLAEDIRKIHRSLPFPEVKSSDEFLRKMIDIFVYGLHPNMRENTDKQISRFMNEHQIDDTRFIRQDDMRSSEGLRQIQTGNPEGIRHLVMEYEDGTRKSECFKMKIGSEEGGASFFEDIGPSVEYYPDGKVASLRNFEYDPVERCTSFPPEYEVYLDAKGRVSNFEVSSRDLEKAWTEFNEIRRSVGEEKVQGNPVGRSDEMKEHKLTKVQQMYLRFCESEKQGHKKGQRM